MFILLHYIDMLEGSRVIRLFRRQDQYGFGFSIRNSRRGPHHVASIEKNSPASISGLKQGDLLLRINDTSIAERDYTNAIEIIKRECIENDEVELLVVEPQLCPPSLVGRSSSQSDLAVAATAISSAAGKTCFLVLYFLIIIIFIFLFLFLLRFLKSPTIFEI
jgi:predicted metalloprotease with PDZ domain